MLIRTDVLYCQLLDSCCITYDLPLSQLAFTCSHELEIGWRRSDAALSKVDLVGIGMSECSRKSVRHRHKQGEEAEIAHSAIHQIAPNR